MLVLMACTIAVSSPIMMVGGVIMALREDVGSRLDPRRRRPGAVHLRRLRRQPDGPELPQDAVPHRRGQPGAARADHRHPRGPRVRARAARGRAVRYGERRAHRRVDPGRSLDGHHVPAGDAGRERLQRRGDLVRRAPGRQRPDGGRCADRVPLLPDADPDVGDDGDLHADDDPARLGLRRPDHGGPRHHHVGAGGRTRRSHPTRRCAATSTSSTSPSPTRAPTRRCSTTSRSQRGPGRRSR